MSASTITITGNLAADPEMRFTPSGVAVVRFSVGVTERYRDNSGEWKERETSWFPVTAWRALAENIAESLTRGARVTVTGTMRQESWADKTTGEKRFGYKIDADDVGTSLRHATVRITKVSRSAPGPEDPWAGSSAEPETGTAPNGPEPDATVTGTGGRATGKGTRVKTGTGQ
jgi:single-strand DNA-binding protein